MIIDTRSVRVAAGVPKETTGLDANRETSGRKRGLALDVLVLSIGVAGPARLRARRRGRASPCWTPSRRTGDSPATTTTGPTTPRSAPTGPPPTGTLRRLTIPSPGGRAQLRDQAKQLIGDLTEAEAEHGRAPTRPPRTP
ncbi:hypothetical protein ACQ4WX_05020 [Streptomyces lasalocidi]